MSLPAASAFLRSCLPQTAIADHVSRGAYPYAAEVTIALSSQEKFYLMDRNNSDLFRETTTTRMAAYKIWEPAS